MSDLLSPLYVVCGGDEVESFWCFVAFMQRMVGDIVPFAHPTSLSDSSNRNQISFVIKVA